MHKIVLCVCVCVGGEVAPWLGIDPGHGVENAEA